MRQLTNIFGISADGRPSAATREPLSDLTPAGHFLLPIAIGVISLLTIDFVHVSHFVGTLWPSNAIILVALLRHRRSFVNFGSIVLGGAAAIALAGIAGGTDPAASAILAVANIAEVTIALALLSLFQIDAANLASFRNLLIFISIAGGVAPFGSMFISALAFGGSWFVVWRNWYASHALGMIIVAPFLISVTSSEWRARRIRERLPEAAAILAIFVALGVSGFFRSVIFLTAPVILFATVRAGLIGATFATLLTALVATGFVVLGLGQPLFPQPELAGRILGLQVFCSSITSFWSLADRGAVGGTGSAVGTRLSRANSLLVGSDSEQKSHLVTGLRHHLASAEERERSAARARTA